MPVQSRCPHCDSKDIEAMARRDFESSSAMTWYHCRHCERMWSVPKATPPGRTPNDNENSPES